MYSPEDESFKIKTEPLDDFSFGLSNHEELFNTKSTDYFNIKVENIDDENFPLLQKDDFEVENLKMEIKCEPTTEISLEDVAPSTVSSPTMVSIPLTPKVDTDRTFVCSVCNAEYTSVKEFMKHHRSHEETEVKPVRLTQPKTGKEVVKVKGTKPKAGPKTKERKCRICQLEFPTFNELVNHFLTHYNLSLTSPYQTAQSLVPTPTAPQPPKRRTSESADAKLSRHRKSSPHSLKSPPKADSKAARRRRHICTICKMEFATISPLVAHFLTHENLKLEKTPAATVAAPATSMASIKCSQCSYVAPSMSRLKQHLETHKSFPPVICKTCNKSFRTQKLLDQHVNRQHLKIECSICDRTFMKRNDMVEHYLGHFDLSLNSRPQVS